MAEDKSPKQEPKASGKEVFYENLIDGELYALEIVEDGSYGRTHRASNEAHFWEGTEVEFKAQFNRVD